MARRYVRRVAAALAILLWVAVMAVFADEDATTVWIPGDLDDHVSVTRRRQVQPLIYHVDEQLPVGSLIADLRNDLRSACDEGRRTDCNDPPTRFNLLHQRPVAVAAGLFDVDETTGVLRVSGVVDREEICIRPKVVCSVVLEVAAHYAAAGAFDIAVVEVNNTSSYNVNS